MVVLSWPLWIDLADFPAIPLVRWFPDYPRAWSWLGLALVVLGLGLGMTRRLGQVGVGLTIGVMTWLILGDQLRLQPWVYQFLVMGVLLVALPPRSALGFASVWIASVYFHSGLSKLDVSFRQGMGPLFVRTAARVLGFGGHPLLGSIAGVEATAMLMPAAEIVVAILLLIPPTRRLGYLGALLIHAALLVILGPWGLGHSTIVLFWNVALAVEEYILFWPARPSAAMSWQWTLREKVIAIPFGALLVLPFGERIGIFDSWPSHALYADHAEGSTLYFYGDLPPALPGNLPTDLCIAAQPGPTRDRWTLRPTDWTLRVRGVPAYPQIRYANGLAEWIAARMPDDGWLSFSVGHRLRADAWTGHANTIWASGLKQVRELSDGFWFNAHPRDRSRR